MENSNDQKIAEDWIEMIEGPSGKVRETDIYPYLNKWTQEHKPKNILDIGCGQGICSQKIDDDFCDYSGIDASPTMIARAKTIYKNKKFILGTADHLPFSDKTFSAAFSIALWHILPDIQKVAHEMARVLTPKGNFLIITANPNAYSLWTKRYSGISIQDKHFAGTTTLGDGSAIQESLYLHSQEDILQALAVAQLSVDHSTTFRTVGSSASLDQFLMITGHKL